MTYKCGRGTGADQSEEYPVGEQESPISVRTDNRNGQCTAPEGEEFEYWSCDPSAAVSDNKITNMPAGGVVCTAQWKGKEYEVKYMCMMGDVVKDTETDRVRYNSDEEEDWYAFKNRTNVCSAGSEFIGQDWVCYRRNSNSYVDVYHSPRKKWGHAFDVDCIARLKEPQKYDVVYDCANGKGQGWRDTNGGDHYLPGPQEPAITVQSGQGSCDAPSAMHTFGGWSCDTELDSNGNIANMPTKDVNCTANWNSGTNNIIYKGCINGKWSDPAPIDVTYQIDPRYTSYGPGNHFYLPSTNGVQVEGYNVGNAWYLPDAGNPVVYTSTAAFENRTEPLVVCVTLYPLYEVEYDCKVPGKDVFYDRWYTQSNTYNVTVKPKSECGEYYGYTSKPEGWVCVGKTSGDVMKIYYNQFKMPGENVKCTMDWEPNSYTVTYNCNGGMLKSDANEPVTYKQPYTFAFGSTGAGAKCEYVGHTFKKWQCSEKKNSSNTSEHVVGDQLGVGDIVGEWLLDDGMNCKAIWDEDHYDVIYNYGDCGKEGLSDPVYTDSYDSNTEDGGAVYGKKYNISQDANDVMNDNIKGGYTFANWVGTSDGLYNGTQKTYTNALTESNRTYTQTGSLNPYKIEGDLTLTATCTPNKYTVIYDKGNCYSATGGDYEHINGATYNENYSALSGGTLASVTGIYAGTGYTFEGWSLYDPALNEDGDYNATWTGETPWKRTEDLKVYAVCTPNKYKVVYKKGNCEKTEDYGNGFVDDNVEYDEVYEILGLGDDGVDTIVPKEGWEFKGWLYGQTWNTQQDPDLLAGDRSTFNPWQRESNLTLYALCKRKPYYVEYDCDSGQEVTQESPYFVDDVVWVPLGSSNTCVKVGHTFKGWNCYTLDDEAQETDNQLLSSDSSAKNFQMEAANVRCTADWIEDIYKVTYDCNTGTSCEDGDESGCRTPEDSTEYKYGYEVETYGEADEEKLNTCKKMGYEFEEWVCVIDNEEVHLQQGESFDIHHDTTCRATWTPKKYDIIYNFGTCGGEDGQGGYVTGSVTDYKVLEYTKTFNVNDITGTGLRSAAPGYHFLGWSTENGKITQDDVDYPVEMTHGPWLTDGNLELYAVCELVKCPIIYHHNGGDWVDEDVEPLLSYTIKTENEDTFESIYDDGGLGYHKFGGWYLVDNPGSNDTKIETVPGDAALTALAENGTCGIDLYALWIDAGTIEFDCDRGSNKPHGTNKQSEEFNAQIPVPYENWCKPEVCGFAGWLCDDGRTPVPSTRGGDINTMVINEVKHTVLCKSINRHPVEYHVYQFVDDAEPVELTTVNIGENSVTMDQIEPQNYVSAQQSVVYPTDISVPGMSNCVFEGWYTNPEFTGSKVTETPYLDVYAECAPLKLYGKLNCHEGCGDPLQTKDHWLHVGDGENDKVCLYERRQSTTNPAVKVDRQDGSEGYYWLMLTTDPDTPMHKGSQKKMRLKYNGTMYNICDRTTCGDLVTLSD